MPVEIGGTKVLNVRGVEKDSPVLIDIAILGPKGLGRSYVVAGGVLTTVTNSLDIPLMKVRLIGLHKDKVGLGQLYWFEGGVSSAAIIHCDQNLRSIGNWYPLGSGQS